MSWHHLNFLMGEKSGDCSCIMFCKKDPTVAMNLHVELFLQKVLKKVAKTLKSPIFNQQKQRVEVRSSLKIKDAFSDTKMNKHGLKS
jgi:hypothetical protein